MDTFDIKELILKGRRTVREYEIPNIGTVLVRPLTDLELSKSEIAMINGIKDEKTRAYMLGKSDSVAGVDFSAMAEAGAQSNIMIAYLAMKDFVSTGITIEDVAQLYGVSGIAAYVREISGVPKVEAANVTTDDMKDFRTK